jgi:hypothetical protein
MKRLASIILFKQIFFAILAAQVLSGCMSTTRLQLIEPATISLPKNIDTIGVINRFLTKSNSFSSSYGFPLGNEYAFNKEASDACVRVISKALNNGPKYKNVNINQELYRTGNAFFAPALPDSSVIELCHTYHAHAIIVLDGFHSNASTNTVMKSYEIPYKRSYISNGVTKYMTSYRTEYYYVATLTVTYSVGFRLYSGYDGSILDEYKYSNSLSYDNRGTSYSDASNMPDKKNIVVATIGSTSGNAYAHRIAPLWSTVTRSYYSEPNKALQTAHQYVIQKKWEEAHKIWNNLYNSSTRNRMKGLAAYNIALAYEMNDELEKSMEWAKKAREHFAPGSTAEGRAKKYLTILKQRMSVREKLIEQMSK